MSNSIKRFDEENKKRPAVVGRFRYILYLLHFLQQSHSVCHRFLMEFVLEAYQDAICRFWLAESLMMIFSALPKQGL